MKISIGADLAGSVVKRMVVCLVCLGIGVAAAAQANFLPGSVTRSNGEKVQGLIDYREWLRNPKSIWFKSSSQANAMQFKPMEVMYFEITNKDRYESAVVKKNMNSLNPELDAMPDAPAPPVTDTVFLRVLYTGALFNLYNLRDEKNRFYTKDSMNGYRELSFGQVIVAAPRNTEYKQTQDLYKNELMQYATDFDRLPTLRRAAEKLRYSENSLVAFAKLLHNDKKAEEAVTKRFFPFVGAGLSLSTFKMKDHILLDGMSFTSSFSPLFSVGADWFPKRKRNALFLRAEAAYFQTKTAGEKSSIGFSNQLREYTYKMNMTTLATSLTSFLSIYRTPNLRIYAGPSVGFNFSSYSNQLFTEKISVGSLVASSRAESPYFVFERTWLNLSGKAGFIFKDKWQFDVSQSLFGQFSRYIDFEFSGSTQQARLAYRF